MIAQQSQKLAKEAETLRLDLDKSKKRVLLFSAPV